MGDHRAAVGGLWDEIGGLAFGWLVDHGLDPSDRLLDVGCGSGRIGRRLVDYLEPGHYWGVDREQWLLDAAEVDRSRRPRLVRDPDFGFDRLGARWTVALAHSLLPHLPPDRIAVFLARLRPLLDGPLHVTHFHPDGPHTIVTRDDKDPYHQTVEEIAGLAEGWTVEPVGGYAHPRGQRMLRLTPA